MANQGSDTGCGATACPSAASLWQTQAEPDAIGLGEAPVEADWRHVVLHRAEIEKERLAAFRTPVTEETLRRHVG